ncbi:unnamed protein product [Paramecium sonneborni]|uniref:Uncharacterized protein n=1 Tax=Paramecium sonneborni TaxID=65129 RepID=A0A8S1R0S0_9CILI|nr:unnamed protein product [Paramecium sonneborni]
MCQDQNINQFEGCFALQVSCVEGCRNCIQGICFECQDGWEYIQLIQNCVPLCWDLMINQHEEFDDGNLIPYDECDLCKFQCSQDCLNCLFGQCLEYQQSTRQIQSDCIFDPYFINYIDQSYYDNFLSQRQSRQTMILNQYCNIKELGIFGFNKQNSIRIQYCDQQLLGQYLKCQLFFQLSLSLNNQQCIPYCNDGITILDEICDDINNIQLMVVINVKKVVSQNAKHVYKLSVMDVKMVGNFWIIDAFICVEIIKLLNYP